jgi:hypothetical protein
MSERKGGEEKNGSRQVNSTDMDKAKRAACVTHSVEWMKVSKKGMKMDYLGYLMTVSNLQDYVGKWIAVVDKEIVASGDNGKTVFEQAKSKYPKKEPFIMKLPAETVMLL